METPRCTRIRRRFGPKALSLMARTLPQERYQRRDAVEGTKGVRPRRGTFRFSTVDYGFRGRRERRGRATGSIGEDKCLVFSLCSSLFCAPLRRFSVLMQWRPCPPLRAVSIEFAARRGLLRPDAAGDDVGFRVVLTFYFCPAEPPQDRELADVGQRVGDRTLEQFLGGCRQRRLRREIRVEALEGGEKPFGFAVPFDRRRVPPGFGTLRLRQRPVVQIAE